MSPPGPPNGTPPGKLYARIPDRGPGGFDGQLLAFAEELREEGMAVGTSELLDAFAALGEIGWGDQTDFKEAIAATLAKSPDDRRTFELVFERFFFRAAEAEAARQEIGEAGNAGAVGQSLEIDLEALRQQIAAALQQGSEAAMRDLARLAIAAFGKGEGSGVLGVDVQRIRRALGLRTEPQPDLPADDPRRDGVPRDQLRRFEAHLRRELERALIERTASLPPKRPLTELDRALPTGPIQDLAAVHRVVAQLKRRLASQGHELRGRKRHAHVDVRRTMRASLQTGGVPIELKYRPLRPRRPEIFVLCDVSTSVTSASTFFLSVLHALHDSFRKLRSFVFIERISEVTEVFERERDFRAASEAVSRDAGVADISGYTDYGRVWTEFLALIEDELHPRATVIVLGDARTNGRPPRDDVFAAITAKAGRTFWLNPEPRLYWNYGDSVIAAYAEHCTAFECWRTDQLEEFVKALARPVVA
ncbi:MAG TPA: VWA domain-containing protein [Solirubrobacteraceae bacterium]|nr:VWA domain-containing protein [Solirubrobacteraceae bacterium]